MKKLKLMWKCHIVCKHTCAWGVWGVFDILLITMGNSTWKYSVIFLICLSTWILKFQLNLLRNWSVSIQYLEFVLWKYTKKPAWKKQIDWVLLLIFISDYTRKYENYNLRYNCCFSSNNQPNKSGFDDQQYFCLKLIWWIIECFTEKQQFSRTKRSLGHSERESFQLKFDNRYVFYIKICPFTKINETYSSEWRK